jgi:hypothetical protein
LRQQQNLDTVLKINVFDELISLDNLIPFPDGKLYHLVDNCNDQMTIPYRFQLSEFFIQPQIKYFQLRQLFTVINRITDSSIQNQRQTADFFQYRNGKD